MVTALTFIQCWGTIGRVNRQSHISRKEYEERMSGELGAEIAAGEK
jgi:hypothetical protein